MTRLYYDFDDEGDIELSLYDSEIKDALEEIIFDELGIRGDNCSKLFYFFVDNYIDLDELIDQYHDELQDYFEDEAHESLRESNRERELSPLERVGMHQSDFI